MKTRFRIFLFSLVSSLGLMAQAPQKISYQTLIRNSGGQLMTNQQVGIKISILQGSENGIVVFAERHTPTTNANGLASLQIGAGTVLNGNFSNIIWSQGPYFITTETDLNGGTSYTIVSTQQLLSVPYALYSGNGILGVSAIGDSLLFGNGTSIIIPGISAANQQEVNNCDLSNVFNETLTYGTTTDIDGNTYKTIVIGSREWMAENLKVSRYNNGDLIPNIIDSDEWITTSLGAWCNYGNNSEYDCAFGKLYNSYAILDDRGLCPAGFRIPTIADRDDIISTLTFDSCGAKMKSTDEFYWTQPNLGATNTSGFSGLPGGLRSNVGGGGNFYELGNAAWFGFSDNNGSSTFVRCLLSNWPKFDSSGLVGYYNYFTNNAGVSVRCVRD